VNYSTQKIDNETFDIIRDSFFIPKEFYSNESLDNHLDQNMAYDDTGFSITGCKLLIKFLNRISSRKNIPSVLSGNKKRNNQNILSRFGYELRVNAIQVIEFRNIMQSFKLHPKIEVFYEFVESSHLIELIDDSILSGNTDTLNSLLTKFSEKLKSPKQLNNERNFLKGAIKNYKSLCSYVNGLFQNYSRLLVVRVDLAYQGGFGRDLPIAQIISHKNKILSKRKDNPLAEDVIGYAWRLEYTKLTGFHYHLVVFMDGSKFRNEVIAAQKIGNRWKEITDGKGRFYNCGLDKSKYRYVGIGLVDYHNIEMRKNMMKALSYLTKAEKLIKLNIQSVRTFGRGQNKKKQKSMGRPRKKMNTDVWPSFLNN